MSIDLTSVIAASARWLLAAYPAPEGALSQALAEAQARQAVTLAAALRYPTGLDVQLLHLLGPSGPYRLDWVTGCDLDPDTAAWRTWVDETIVSWAACLLADPNLASLAQTALTMTGHHAEAGSLQRLANPSSRDTEAAALLRHPDLLEGIAALHRPQLIQLLSVQDRARP
ncbi:MULTISPECIES: hypothetical protein [Streptomyces]|uniref:hypothetical protein n=1 Tax=Streptomyces TaxID=1883 RepID=UPI000BD22538|nr:hypothetical protein [Streptomyces sp. OV198]SOE58776.1 hypothetical protein SAMN05446589_1418 [Streptomyces sp. OV198]